MADTGIFFHIVDFKSAYISLNFDPEGLACDANLYEIVGWESSDIVRFDLRPLIQGETRITKLKSD